MGLACGGQKTRGPRSGCRFSTELKNRGVQDMLMACVDGLNGFPEAIAADYPETRLPLGMVHRVRNRLT